VDATSAGDAREAERMLDSATSSGHAYGVVLLDPEHAGGRRAHSGHEDPRNHATSATPLLLLTSSVLRAGSTRRTPRRSTAS
jgi:hypothetical protein